MAKGFKRNTTALIFAFVFLFSALLLGQRLAMAESTDNIKDYLDYLSADEIEEVQGLINEAVKNTNLDLVIVITDNTEGKSSMDYADDFFDYNGFGIGDDASGLLMLINMDIREVWISTTGKAIDIFTDDRISNLIDPIYGYLTNDNYFGASKEFVKQVEYFAKKGVPEGQHREETKNPGSIGQIPGTQPNQGNNGPIVVPSQPYRPGRSTTTYLERAAAIMKSPGLYLIAIILSIVATAIASLSNKGKSTVGSRTYEEKGSFQLTRITDDFIRETTSRVKINNDTTTHGGGSGGARSSTHTSSSGRSHGGGGRKF